MPTGLRDQFARRIEQARGRSTPDHRRSAWALPEWHTAARSWINATLIDQGWGPSTSITQIRQWAISSVMRIESAGGIAWFKAVFPPFHYEPKMTAFLHQEFGDWVAPVIGTNDREGWLLLAHAGDELLSKKPSPRSACDCSTCGDATPLSRSHR